MAVRGLEVGGTRRETQTWTTAVPSTTSHRGIPRRPLFPPGSPEIRPRSTPVSELSVGGTWPLTGLTGARWGGEGRQERQGDSGADGYSPRHCFLGEPLLCPQRDISLRPCLVGRSNRVPVSPSRTFCRWWVIPSQDLGPASPSS